MGSTGLDGRHIAVTTPVSIVNLAEQNNYNRPSQSSLRQVYVHFSIGVEPLFKVTERCSAQSLVETECQFLLNCRGYSEI